MSNKLTSQEFVQAIKGWSVLDLREAIELLEKDFGLKMNMPGQVQTISKDDQKTGEENEPKVVTLILKSAGERKIEVIKLVREITGLGLLDSKNFVDKLPQAVLEHVEQAKAEEALEKFKVAGGIAEITH